MISLAEGTLPEELISRFPATGCRILSDYQSYGNRYPFCATWLWRESDEPLGVLGRYNGVLRLCAGEPLARLEQLRRFLPFSGAEQLEGPAEMVQALVHTSVETGWVMVYTGKPFPLTLLSVNETPSLALAYHILREGGLLTEGEEEYQQWYCESSHCLRRQGGKFVTVEDKSVAGVTGWSGRYGLITSVATLPEVRRQGLGRQAVSWCVNHILQEGKIPVLMAKSREAEAFYRKLGFSAVQRWGIGEIG